MAGKTDDASDGPKETGPEAEKIADYLRTHPGFLADYPDLVTVLAPPVREADDNVVDLQSYMIGDLQSHVATMSSRERKLLSAAEERLAQYGRAQDAALALLDATSLRNFSRIVRSELPALLDVEIARLCVEAEEATAARDEKAGLSVLEPGTVDELMGHGRDIVLLDEAPDEYALFGRDGGGIASLALLRLGAGSSGLNGLLAFGSTDPDGFHPLQGTDLLAFLARVAEHCVRRWQSKRI